MQQPRQERLKLEAAQAADDASAAADRATESYNNLNDSLIELKNKYGVLENLVRGTEEWNKAVQDVNSSVLSLIEKYPELAGLIKNDGGVLKLDIDSKEAIAVLNEYKKDEAAAKGAVIGAKANLNRAQREYELDKMDDKTFDKFKTEGGELTAIGNLFASIGTGAASGALLGTGIGAGLGAWAGSVVPIVGTAAGAGAGAAAGVTIGTLVGAIGGLVTGLATFQYSMDRAEKKNEANRENVKKLAQAYAKGETGTTKEDITKYIEKQGIAVGEAAEKMAESLLEEAETMREYGESLNAMDAAQKAYYQAMATNA